VKINSTINFDKIVINVRLNKVEITYENLKSRI